MVYVAWHSLGSKPFWLDLNRQFLFNGKHSSWEAVTSGVPQGYVLGPALFLLFINDIQDNINSSLGLLVDDSIVNRGIHNPYDHQIPQQDLETLAEWSKTWLMEFSISKCASLSITRKRNKSQYISIPCLVSHCFKIWGRRCSCLPNSGRHHGEPIR